MKRLVGCLLVMSLLLTLSISAFAQADIKKVDLTENQKNILRAYGLSDEEIENVDIETIRDTLRNGVVVDSEKFAEKPDWNKNKLTADIKAKLDKKNLSQSQINRLNNRGYTYEEIANMEMELIEALLGDAAITATRPSNYVGPVSIPGGGDNEYFHPDVPLETDDIEWYVSASKQYAKYLFNQSEPLPDGMGWSYYLYGEWDDDAQTHQGVDVKHPTREKAVRNVIGNSTHEGEVIRAESGGSFNGCVLVWDDYLKETIVYLHIGTPTVEAGDMVKAGDKIGTQSVSKGHVHFQAQDAKSTSIQPATYNTLKTRIPYGFMTWYID